MNLENEEYESNCSSSTDNDRENEKERFPKRRKLCDSDSSLISKKHYKQKFREEWLADEHFKGWLKKTKDPYKCECSMCNKVLKCGKSELVKHASTLMHKKCLKNINSTQTLKNMLDKCPKNANTVKTAEIKISTFFAEHNVAYSIVDHLVPLMKDIFPDSKIVKELELGRTKTISIIKNVISTVETNETVNNIKQNNFSVLVDGSTDISAIKLLCCLVRYVASNGCVRTDLLELIEIDARDCSAESFYSAFSKCLEKYNIPVKNIIGLASDGEAVMVGSQNSFKTRLEKDTDILIMLKCICHSGALIASHACKNLPRSPEDLIHNITYYLSGSAKRNANLAEIQEFLQVEKQKILKLSETRWLALQHCVVRVLNNWDVLENYFTVAAFEDRKKAADTILGQLKDNAIKCYFYFLKYALNYFNTYNALFQSKRVLIHELSKQSKSLLLQMMQNFVKPNLITIFTDFENPHNFITLEEVYCGPECENFIQKLPYNVKIEIKKKCLAFYITACIEIKNRLPVNDKFFEELSFLDPNVALNSANRNKINSLSNVTNIFNKLVDQISVEMEWRKLSVSIDDDLKEKLLKLPIENFWHEISIIKDFEDNFCFKNLSQLAKLILSLPHSNADAERIFSIVNDIKTKKRNKISSETLNSMCVIRSNFASKNIKCTDYKVTNEHLNLMNSKNLYTKKSN